MREVVLARRAEMKARVEAMRMKYLEPILQRFPRMLPTAPDSAAKYAIVSAILWFAVGLLLALLQAMKLVFPKLLAPYPWLSYGRLAGAQSAVIIWGALFTAFAGAMFAIVPRVTGTKLWSERIGAQTIVLHDQVVLAGVVLLLLGRTQGINGIELPWIIDILIVNSMFMVAQNVFATIARRKEKALAVPLWYFMAALIVLPLTYGFGNFAAPFFVGVNQQIIAGFAVAGTTAGITLLGVGTAYFVLPKATGQPIYSERIALLGFWSFVFAAPFVGQIGAVAGPGQDYLETLAITFAIWLVIPALCVVANFWGTLRGAWGRTQDEPAIRFVVGGTLLLLWGTLQAGVGSLRTMQNVVGHTPWDIATTTALMGGLGLYLIALVYYLFPRMIGRALYSAQWAVRQFWAQTLGLAVVIVAMTAAGLVQGYLQIAGVQTGSHVTAGDKWFVISLATRPLFLVQIAGGALVAFGLFLFVANVMRTATLGDDAEREALPFATAEAEPVAVSA